MSDFQTDRKRGWLIRGINALVTQWDDPMAVWTPGTAGDVASLFWQSKSNPPIYPSTPPPHLALILDNYRQHHPMPI